METREQEVTLLGTCFGIQSRRWDNDRPLWEDEVVNDAASVDAAAPLRFATRGEAEAWIAWQCDKQYASDKEYWEAAEERLRLRRELYGRRRQVLTAAGLWRQPGESVSPLVAPAAVPHVREPVRRHNRYRVVPDADMGVPLHEEVNPIVGEEPLDPCPVCEVSGSAITWRDGHFSCHGCWTRATDSLPFQHADGCPRACWLPDCTEHARETGSQAHPAVVAEAGEGR